MLRVRVFGRTKTQKNEFILSTERHKKHKKMLTLRGRHRLSPTKKKKRRGRRNKRRYAHLKKKRHCHTHGAKATKYIGAVYCSSRPPRDSKKKKMMGSLRTAALNAHEHPKVERYPIRVRRPAVRALRVSLKKTNKQEFGKKHTHTKNRGVGNFHKKRTPHAMQCRINDRSSKTSTDF